MQFWASMSNFGYFKDESSDALFTYLFLAMQKWILRAETDLAELSRILIWFDEFARPALTESLTMQCQTLLAEGFTNAVRHAHQSQAIELPIEIEVTLSETEITIRMWDYGRPFDLMGKLNSLPTHTDPNSAGGRGLKLIERLADWIGYDRSEGDRNCLVIIKKNIGG
jgi:serine/threonine-protein kinase RsbW